jgi:hypothetical protein
MTDAATPAIARLVTLPRIQDARGNLSFVEGGRHVEFPIQRAYWIYDVPGGEARGGHAHRTLDELLIALSGSFDVRLDDGARAEVVPLNRSYFGLLVPRMTWRRLENFSTNAVCLALASAPFDESGYVREHAHYLRERGAARGDA